MRGPHASRCQGPRTGKRRACMSVDRKFKTLSDLVSNRLQYSVIPLINDGDGDDVMR